jgi:hypothetical protein
LGEGRSLLKIYAGGMVAPEVVENKAAKVEKVNKLNLNPGGF